MKQFRRGLITEEERYERVISIWSSSKDVIQGKLMKSLDEVNPIYMMSDSGRVVTHLTSLSWLVCVV